MKQKETQEKENKKQLLKIYKKKVYNLYKEGYTLGMICRNTVLDISSVIFILKKLKIKKRKLYYIYENQISKSSTQNTDLFLENEKYYLEKFFPSSETSYFSSSYVWYWKEKYKKLQLERDECNHKFKNITCAQCGKILADATNIEISSNNFY
jgi:hypothetical protein